jgi:hypothetical protein
MRSITDEEEEEEEEEEGEEKEEEEELLLAVMLVVEKRHAHQLKKRKYAYSSSAMTCLRGAVTDSSMMGGCSPASVGMTVPVKCV